MQTLNTHLPNHINIQRMCQKNYKRDFAGKNRRKYMVLADGGKK